MAQHRDAAEFAMVFGTEACRIDFVFAIEAADLF